MTNNGGFIRIFLDLKSLSSRDKVQEKNNIDFFFRNSCTITDLDQRFQNFLKVFSCLRFVFRKSSTCTYERLYKFPFSVLYWSWGGNTMSGRFPNSSTWVRNFCFNVIRKGTVLDQRGTSRGCGQTFDAYLGHRHLRRSGGVSDTKSTQGLSLRVESK